LLKGTLMTHSTTLSVFTDDVFTDAELRTLTGFLGGYSGLTRDAYSLDLRQFAQWCHDRHTGLFAVARSDIEAFARNLEDLGRARATISRRLCTITCLYRYAVEEGLLDRSPAVHVRRRAWTTSPTRLAWTATRSAPCSSPAASPAHAITH
jgi:integrase/recombinase XerD